MVGQEEGGAGRHQRLRLQDQAAQEGVGGGGTEAYKKQEKESQEDEKSSEQVLN